MYRCRCAKPDAGCRRPIARLAIMTVATLLCAAGDEFAQPPDGPVPDISRSGEVPARPLAIQAMTTIDANGTGYFSDPHPVRLAPSSSKADAGSLRHDQGRHVVRLPGVHGMLLVDAGHH